MKLSDFLMLDEAEKELIILHEGAFIARRKEIDCIVFLFDLGSYYVETYCNPKNKKVKEYIVFDNTKWLAPYLESIQIDSLLK